MFTRRERLIIFDADGTLVDAFGAIDETFAAHGMRIGDLERFQNRRALFKYLGGLREFPGNLRKQFGKRRRHELLATLTEVYRERGRLYPGLAELLNRLIDTPGVRVGLISRNVTNDPEITLRMLFGRNGVDLGAIDHVACIPLRESKLPFFRRVRERFDINPAHAFVCGDEHKDYAAATGAGMHPLIVSYGFEGFERLTIKFEVPPEVVLRSPDELRARVLHALDLQP
jgi:phosphoglycolate phosphatase